MKKRTNSAKSKRNPSLGTSAKTTELIKALSGLHRIQGAIIKRLENQILASGRKE